MKLCECGCGQPAPIAKKTERAKGRIKGQPTRFARGHSQRTPKQRQMRSERLRGRRLTAEHRRAISRQNEKHPCWKGDDAGYGAIRRWLRRHHPKTGVCEACGAESATDYAFLRHPEPHTRVREDYAELCRS